MKKNSILLGYFATFFTAAYLVFKFLMLPGAAALMKVAGVLISIYFPLLFLRRLRDSTGQVRLVHKFGALLLAFTILSIILRFNHWAFVIYEDREIIPIITFSPWIYIITYCCISFIFVPWLLYDLYKHNREGFIKNCIGGLGFALLPLGLILKDYKLFHWRYFIAISTVLIIVIYLPWHIRSTKDKSSNFDATYQILIIGYILLLFVSGIFWEFAVTYQDELMKVH